MADMMAGQWWTRVCSLPSVMPPQAAFSCYRKIFDNNVVKFADICNKEHGSIGEKCLRGAVNGMRPDGIIDDTCLQSREVWTGTTYGLAAAMMHESYADEHLVGDDCMTGFTAFTEAKEIEEYSPLQPLQSTNTALPVAISDMTPLDASQRRELQAMAFSTAQGIHDAGWQAYGYQFATPEAWTANGNYRALGYMRPLAIWAMQFPSVQRKQMKTNNNHRV
jgi:non-lysosomal glucosylceramidase